MQGNKIPGDDDFEDEDEAKEQEEQKEQEYLELEEQNIDRSRDYRKKHYTGHPRTSRNHEYAESTNTTPQKHHASSRRTQTSPDRMEPDVDNPTNMTEDQLRIQRILYERIVRKNQQSSAEKVDVFRLGTGDGPNHPIPLVFSDEGLPQRMIDAIITNRFHRSMLRTDDPSKLECSICCTDFKEGDEIKILQCLHTHHKTCIDEWFTKKSVCPDCKFNMRTLNMHQLI